MGYQQQKGATHAFQHRPRGSRETGRQKSFECNCEMDLYALNDLSYFLNDTMGVVDARRLAVHFQDFHNSVDYDRALIDSTEENDLLRKISDELSRAGYDLYIDNITYE